MFVGAGTYRSMKAGLPNEEAPGVYDALPFLIANTKQVMGLAESTQEPYVNTAGLNVVVLGAAIRRWTACAPRCAMAPAR